MNDQFGNKVNPNAEPALAATAGYDSGGPAFAAMNETCGQDGMSLRDYFAARALQGMLGNHAITDHQAFDIDGCANEAFRYADAMIRARSHNDELRRAAKDEQ